MGDRNHIVTGIVSIICLLFAYNSAFADCENWVARIASVQGRVEAKRADSATWQPAKLDNTYCAGDQIRVNANSRAAIILINDTLLRLDQHSAVKLTAIRPKQPSLIELFKGIGHFISRVPRSLKVETPTMNAAIEGTEFVIAATAHESRLTVFEGTVLATNPQGQLRLSSGESAVADKNAAPTMRLLAKPRNAVQWALYYPPILDPNLKPGEPVYRAAALLNTGQVAEARKILDKLPDNGRSLALQAILAIVQNHSKEALQLAQLATVLAPDAAATYLALSYAWQAGFQLDYALASAQQATAKEPGNAIAWARVAELQLATGELDEALAAAQQASRLNNTLSRTQTVLGYAHLMQIDIDAAKRSFARAIQLDQTDPLPRLGLGLAKIHDSDVAAGRREIEIAASLDPNNTIVRSYLGKAYFEEKRDTLANEQFAMAKQLDKFDPTPWFYDAIVKQSENRPVEALASLQKSIELNNNRAVYRSSLQLDQDTAARSVSQARIYKTLGFDQLALSEGWNSLNYDPTNYSAHRFLADSYASLPQHEIGRVSELLQAQLWQPLNLTPIQPQLADSGTGIIEGLGPSESALNEYSSLFTRDRIRLNVNAISGSNATKGDDLVLAGLTGPVAYSLGQYHYESDGFRENNQQKQNQQNAFIQYSPSVSTSLQLEYRNFSRHNGDLPLRADPADYDTTLHENKDVEVSRLGVRHDFDNRHKAILSYIEQDNIFTQYQEPQANTTVNYAKQEDATSKEAQYVYLGDFFKVITGIGKYEADASISNTLKLDLGFPFGIITSATDTQTVNEHDNGYIYTQLGNPAGIMLDIGVSYDDYKGNVISRNQFNPKLGLSWTVSSDLRLRLAIFRALKRDVAANQTIEPTNIAGFNQFYDDASGSDSRRIGFGLDYKSLATAYAGVELSQRDINVPYDKSGTALTTNWEERLFHLYHYNSITQSFSIALEYVYERYDYGYDLAHNNARKISTHKIPLGMTYTVVNGIILHARMTYIEQAATLFDSTSLTTSQHGNNFTTVDAELSYRLPNRLGKLSIGASNLFDTKINYQEPDQYNPTVYPERFVYTRLTLTL